MKKILILSIFLTFFGYSIYGKCQDNSLIDAEKQKQLECYNAVAVREIKI